MELRVVARHRDTACLSDKPVDKVIGYAVRFEDGSWANLLSRRHAGGAPGRVFFLTAPADTDAAPGERRTESIGRVLRLALGGGCADVVVDATEGDGQVELCGDAGFVRAVTVEERARTIHVSWNACERRPDGDGGARPIVRCRVTSGCQLTVDAHGDGHFWVAAPVRDLRLVLADDASFVGEAVDGMEVDLNGAGQAFVGRARGRARVRATASGSAVVAGGRIAELDAEVRAAGSIVVHAVVDDALLANTGSGSLIVPAIARRSGERHGGVGPVVVGRPAHEALEGW